MHEENFPLTIVSLELVFFTAYSYIECCLELVVHEWLKDFYGWFFNIVKDGYRDSLFMFKVSFEYWARNVLVRCEYFVISLM